MGPKALKFVWAMVITSSAREGRIQGKGSSHESVLQNASNLNIPVQRQEATGAKPDTEKLQQIVRGIVRKRRPKGGFRVWAVVDVRVSRPVALEPGNDGPVAVGVPFLTVRDSHREVSCPRYDSLHRVSLL